MPHQVTATNTALFISYHYPPSHQVGYERVLKFRKHLPAFGYKTLVLGSRVLGASREDRTQGVYRPWEPALVYRYIMKKALRSGLPSIGTAGSISENTRFRAVRNWLIEWLMIPDLQIPWLPGAVWLGMQTIRRENVDIIVSSSGPETNHLVGLCLSRLTGVPLVADFRDGWMFEPLKGFLRANRARRTIDGRLERLVVSKAAAITTVSDPLTDYFRKLYDLPPERVVTITNGYDPDDWRGVHPAPRRDNTFRIVHTGAFGSSRVFIDPRPLLEALRRLPVGVRNQIELLLIGDLKEAERRMISGLDLKGIVSAIPPVPRSESLGYQLSSDILLLVAGADRSVATSKLYEYLYARRPILAITDQGTAAAAIVRQAQAGLVTDPVDPAGIVASITHLFDLWKQDRLDEFCQGDISAYHRRHLASQLAATLDEVLVSPSLEA